MADKIVSFRFAVDETSARAAKRIVEDLTRSVQKLVETAQRAGQSLGGLGGGVAFTNKAVRPGQGGATFAASPAARGQTGIVTSVLGGDASQLQRMTTASQQAFQAATTGVRTFTQSATSDLQRLQRVVDQLVQSLGGISGSIPGKGGGFGGPLTGGAPPVGNWGFLSQIAPRAPGFGPGGANNNWSPFFNGGRIASGVAASAGGGGRGVGGALAAAGGGFDLGGAGGFLGAIAARAGLGGIVGAGFAPAAAVGAYSYAADAYQKQRTAALSYDVNEMGGDRLARLAAAAAPFREAYSQGRAGNLSYTAARNEVLKSASQKAMMDQASRLELARRVAGLEGGSLGVFGRKVESEVGRQVASGYTASSPAAVGSGGLPNPFTTQKANLEGLAKTPGAMDILEEITLRGMSKAEADQYRANIQSQMALQNPRFRSIMESVVPNAMGNVGLRRQGFYGVPRGREAMEYMKSREASLTASGYSLAEEAGARRQIVGGAGMGYLGLMGGTSILSMQYGGLSNAVDLMRTGGILGGSARAGRNFLTGTVQGSIGRGGLDVTAGSQLFGSLAGSAMASGQFGAGNTFGTYAGAMAGLVGGGAGAPLDVAEQQRRAAMVQQGMGVFGGFTTGAAAPLYQMTSLLGGIKGAGGYGGASEALSRMSPELLTAISRGGKVPEWARGLGVTAAGAGAALKYQNNVPLMEVVDSMVGGDAGDLLSKIRGAQAGGGGFLDVARSETSGLRGRAKAKRAQQMAEQMGGVLFSQGLAPTPEAGAGVFLSQLGQDKEFAPFLKGRGAGAAGPQGLEKAGLDVQSKELARDAKMMADKVGELTNLIGQLFGQTTGAEVGVAQVGSNTSITPGQEAQTFARALQVAAKAAEMFANAQKPQTKGGAVKAR